MTNILYVTSSPRPDTSLSNRVGRRLVDALQASHAGATVTVRDLGRDPLPHIDQDFVIATRTPAYEKVVSNLQEVKARDGKLIVICDEGDDEMKTLADDVIEIPHAVEALQPILAVVPTQLLAYYIALRRGCDVDQPRNLAKSVTVE